MSFSLIRFLTAGLMLLILLAGAAQAADNPERDWRFGLAINPLSYYGLREIGRSQGLISIELNALSKNRHWELALPIYYEVEGYADNKLRKTFHSDLALRFYPWKEKSRAYLGPVLRYRVDDGYADFERFGNYKLSKRITRLGAGLTVGFGRKSQSYAWFPGLYYWGVSATYGWYLTNRGEYIEGNEGIFDPRLLTTSEAEVDVFYNLTFFRWGVYF